MMLTFAALRAANAARQPTFRNRRGELIDCTTWTPSDWLEALIGEVGECANLQKKVRRGDYSPEELPEVQQAIRDEFADIQTYLDLWCAGSGGDLGADTIAKFNRVSDRVGSDVFISPTGQPHRRLKNGGAIMPLGWKPLPVDFDAVAQEVERDAARPDQVDIVDSGSREADRANAGMRVRGELAEQVAEHAGVPFAAALDAPYISHVELTVLAPEDLQQATETGRGARGAPASRRDRWRVRGARWHRWREVGAGVHRARGKVRRRWHRAGRRARMVRQRHRGRAFRRLRAGRARRARQCALRDPEAFLTWPRPGSCGGCSVCTRRHKCATPGQGPCNGWPRARARWLQNLRGAVGLLAFSLCIDAPAGAGRPSPPFHWAVDQSHALWHKCGAGPAVEGYVDTVAEPILAWVRKGYVNGGSAGPH
jgi:NTP pyrophosphatase (non-canonical NTP hydrolase)